MSRLALAVVVVAAMGGLARAGGFELDEQSPRGTAMVGAQVAAVHDASAAYYNPAGLAFEEGLGALAGANVLVNGISVDAPVGHASGTGTTGTPTVFVAQRVSSHLAVAVGVFSNFVEQLSYDGALAGTSFDLTTTTINPQVSIRPLPWISLGFGVDIVPSSMTLSHDAGMTRSSTTATGIGGNLGIQVIAVPRWLELGATYRSAYDLDLTGQGDLAGVGSGLTVSGTLPMPHLFDFGVSSRVHDKLTLAFDAKLALWHDLSSLTLAYTPPGAPSSMAAANDVIQLNQRDSYGFRLGAEARPVRGLWLAAGVGYDRTPVRRGWLQAVTPDNDRVLVGVGAGYRWRWLEGGVGYSAQVVLSRTSTNPDPGMATFSGVRHVVSMAVGVRFPKLEKTIAPKYVETP